ncbi:hypothetical protein JCM10914A_33210 [Paenibacillus sp. JCM 10914]|nr:hypothetical protein JCM10914_3829 [Paenibacillus sp. JCM 10914]
MHIDNHGNFHGYFILTACGKSMILPDLWTNGLSMKFIRISLVNDIHNSKVWSLDANVSFME